MLHNYSSGRVQSGFYLPHTDNCVSLKINCSCPLCVHYYMHISSHVRCGVSVVIIQPTCSQRLTGAWYELAL